LGLSAVAVEALAVGVVLRGGTTVGESPEPPQAVRTAASAMAPDPAAIRRPPTNTGKA
jgi:hypothetical protein